MGRKKIYNEDQHRRILEMKMDGYKIKDIVTAVELTKATVANIIYSYSIPPSFGIERIRKGEFRYITKSVPDPDPEPIIEYDELEDLDEPTLAELEEVEKWEKEIKEIIDEVPKARTSVEDLLGPEPTQPALRTKTWSVVDQKLSIAYIQTTYRVEECGNTWVETRERGSGIVRDVELQYSNGLDVHLLCEDCNYFREQAKKNLKGYKEALGV